MDLLKKAVAMDYRCVSVYCDESALDSLRGREDFKKLIADLEAKAKADKD